MCTTKITERNVCLSHQSNQAIPLQQLDEIHRTDLRPIAELYQAVPLPKNQKSIRVLDVHASSTSHLLSHDLSATVRLVLLDAEPKPWFTTLSYVWGQNATEDLPIITLHTRDVKSELRLTESCFQALLHLREKLGSFTIWVDAICIDQNLAAEKTHQLNQMAEIYGMSDKTYIWLGQHNKQVEHYPQSIMVKFPMKYMFRFGTGLENPVVDARSWTAALMLPYHTATITGGAIRLSALKLMKDRDKRE